MSLASGPLSGLIPLLSCDECSSLATRQKKEIPDAVRTTVQLLKFSEIKADTTQQASTSPNEQSKIFNHLLESTQGFLVEDSSAKIQAAVIIARDLPESVGRDVLLQCAQALMCIATEAFDALATDELSFDKPAETFVSELLSTLSVSRDSLTKDVYRLTSIFEFLEELFQGPEVSGLDSEILNDIATLSYAFQLINSKTVAQKASRLILTPPMLDSILYRISIDVMTRGLSLQLSLHNTQALYFLTAVVEQQRFTSSERFQQLVCIPTFWTDLAENLVEGSPERRKLCLYILEQSLHSITGDVSIPGVVQFKITSRTQYLRLWSKFFTVARIIAIDASLHQAQASLRDLFSLLPDKKAINNPSVPILWPMCLLRLGLTSSLSSVRVEVAKFMLSLSASQLSLFKDSSAEFLDLLFEFIGQASFFTVETAGKSFYCAHGDLISDFVSRALHAFENPVSVIDMLLDIVIIERGRKKFEALLVYTLRGIYSVLYKERSFCTDMGLETDRRLLKLLEMKFENLTLKRVLTLYVSRLRLLLNGDYISVNQYVDGALASYDCVDDAVENITLWINPLHLDQFSELVASELARYASIDWSDDRARRNTAICCRVHLSLNKAIPPSILSILGDSAIDQDMRLHLAAIISSEELELAPEAQKAEFLSAKTSLIFSVLTGAKETIETPDLQQWLDQLRELYDPGCGKETCELANSVCGLLLDSTLKDSGPMQLATGRLTHFSSRDFYRAFNDFLTAVFSLCRIRMKYHHEKTLFQPIISAIGKLIQSAHTAENLNLYCEFIRDSLASLDPSEEFLSHLLDINYQIWESMVGSNSSTAHQSFGLTAIEVIFNPALLARAVATNQPSERLEAIAHEMVRLGYARRLVLSTFARNLHEFLNTYPAEFNQSTWIADILVELYCFQQNRDNLFLIDEPVVEVCVSDGLQTQRNLPEMVGKAHVTTILGHKSISESFAHAILQAIDNFSPSLFALETGGEAASELQRVSLSELLLLVGDFVDTSSRQSYASRLLEVLKSEFSPRVRTSLEWMLARLVSNDENLFDLVIWDPLSTPEDRPRYLASILTIVVLIIRARFSKGQVGECCDLINRFCPMLLAFATTNRAVLRHTATSLILGIRDMVDTLAVTDSLKVTFNIVDQHVRASPTFGTFVYGDDVLWDIYNDFNIVSVCGFVSSKVNDQIKLPRYELTDELMRMAALPADTMRVKKYAGYDEQSSAIDATDSSKKSSAKLASAQGFVTPVDEDTNSSTLQTKSNTRITTPRPVRTTKGRMIVLASLVDKAPNLGGICRLADVLGAELLCIPDMTLIRSREFQAVAVTADKWMPMKEVKPDYISEYLQQCRVNGYKIWGIEQTDDSTVLTSELKFPEKVVLILGKEKEGIPPSLLRELDCAVEIKQVGIVRSMNIQTATAVVVNAYAMQHC
ncbi:hypothetical protein BZA70DRAFT_266482 [Myxozyma melibiosi]|uniref:tRNA/rRNA methyltransferase SpoU type domain-containing protein n=1 Tax=Myxozyma melibiosi TaxID=54550 RepID=A0ABR1F8I0_9ASCO